MEHDYQRKPNRFSLLLVLTTRGIGQEAKRRRPERAASHIPPGIFISSSHRTPSRRGNTRGQVLPGAAGLSRGRAAPRGLRSIYRGTAPRVGSPTHSPASPHTQPRIAPHAAPHRPAHSLARSPAPPPSRSRSPAAPQPRGAARPPVCHWCGIAARAGPTGPLLNITWQPAKRGQRLIEWLSC